MNIYPFLGKEEASNRRFVDELLNGFRVPVDGQFGDRLLVIIESCVKGRLGNLIHFEKEVAVNAELCVDEVGFIEGVSRDPEWQEYFFEEYPMVAEYLPQVYAKVKALLADVLRRLDQDLAELDLPAGSVLGHIDIGEGDFHNGTCTCRLSFTNGVQLFYKPRSLKIDIEMTAFFLRFQGLLGVDIFYPVENIDKGTYGWSRAVPLQDCGSADRVANHYKGLGIFTALAHALKIEDIIFDNLISTNGRLALIDLECCLCTRLPINKDVFYRFNSLAGDRYRDSLIHSGIIPRYTYEGLRSDGESDGALSYIPVRNKRAGQTGSGDHSAERHIPRLHGEVCLIKDHFDGYLEGFRLGYFAVVVNRPMFLEYLTRLEEQAIETRIIYRPTKVYATLLNESYHVDYLKNRENRQALYKHLHNAEHIGFPRAVIDSEIRQLELGDIPAFRKRIGSNEVYACNGASLEIAYASEADTEQVRQRLAAMGDDDYEWQRDTIIQSVKIFEDLSYPEPVPVFSQQADAANTETALGSFLQGLIAFLEERLLIEKDSVSLLDSYININNGWAFGPIGPGLANGTDGLALVFAAYGHLFGQQKYSKLAERIVASNTRLFERHASNDLNYLIDPHFVFSPFHFPGSMLYVSKVMGHFDVKHSTPAGLDEGIEAYVKKWLHKDESYDFLIGSCGAIFLFYQLAKAGDARYRELTALCADHLCRHARHAGAGMVSWSSHKFLGLGGFSHGTASYSVALLLAHDLLQKQEYFDLFEQSLRYDRSLFSEERRQYRDNRHYPEVVYSHSWAHGSGGIGLSRLLIANLLPDYPGLKQEIEVCRFNTEQVINANMTYSLSGGFAGNLELLRAFNRYCGHSNAMLEQAVMDRVNYYTQDARRLETDNHHIQLLLNQGIAGLAYALMRYLQPETVPSLLTLGTSHTFGSPHLYGK